MQTITTKDGAKKGVMFNAAFNAARQNSLGNCSC